VDIKKICEYLHNVGYGRATTRTLPIPLTSLDTWIYSLPGEHEDWRKTSYPFDFGMGKRINFFIRNEYMLAKLAHVLPRAILPITWYSLILNFILLNIVTHEYR